jgi:hypothetical protein
MKTVGYSKREILDIIPAKVILHERWDGRVTCPHDEAIVSSPMQPAIVERGVLGDGVAPGKSDRSAVGG